MQIAAAVVEILHLLRQKRGIFGQPDSCAVLLHMVLLSGTLFVNFLTHSAGAAGRLFGKG